MSRTVPDVVHELCLSLPETDEILSHGSPRFRVAEKGFAIFVVNHHGDGRVAMWLASPPGIQRLYTEINPDAYFVPPYIGPRGWLGVDLNKGLPWEEIAARVGEAYKHIAPGPLAAQLPEIIEIGPPDRDMSPNEIVPMLDEYPQQVLKKLARICDALPETSFVDSLGSPAWKAGKKVFLRALHNDGRLKLQFWVGVEQQTFFTDDTRFSLPMYLGSKGWIELDVQEAISWQEIDSLAKGSYRHFALKRMLNALDD